VHDNKDNSHLTASISQHKFPLKFFGFVFFYSNLRRVIFSKGKETEGMGKRLK